MVPGQRVQLDERVLVKQRLDAFPGGQCRGWDRQATAFG
jgi:hypothetical protein